MLHKHYRSLYDIFIIEPTTQLLRIYMNIWAIVKPKVLLNF